MTVVLVTIPHKTQRRVLLTMLAAHCLLRNYMHCPTSRVTRFGPFEAEAQRTFIAGEWNGAILVVKRWQRNIGPTTVHHALRHRLYVGM